MTTVAETKLAELEAEYEQFRKDVVKKAMVSARRHGWCDVVKRTLVGMGLSEYLPDTYAVQSREAGGRWTYYDQDLSNANGAIATAKRRRQNVIDNAKRKAERRTTRQSAYINEYVTASNITAAIKHLTELKENWTTSDAEAPEFVAPVFPKYRAIRKTPDGKLAEILYVAE